MGYSSRYHVASLAAVFIALAVGILIGAALGSDIVSGTAENLEDDLSEDLDALRAENAELQEALDFQQRFSERLAPAVTAGRLPAQEVALIGLGDVDTATLKEDIEAALDPTGAELTLVGTLQEPPNADAVISQLLPAAQQREGDGEQLELAAERAGRLLSGSGTLSPDQLSTLMSRFSGDPEGLDGAVVVRAPQEDVSPREQGDIEQLEEGLLRGLRAADVRVVGAEREDTEPSSIEFFEAQGLATVDNIDQLPGKVALVLALDGADGDFGVKETAESLLPDLIEPSPPVEADG